MRNHIPSDEICSSEEEMCPACDFFCDYWKLKETCLHSKILSMFDNGSTVVFAVFMSIWGKSSTLRFQDHSVENSTFFCYPDFT